MFSERLKLLRLEKALTQQELGEALGISRTTIAGYEKSGKQPSFETLIQVAKYFDVTTDYLVGMSDNRKSEDSNIGKRLGLCDEAIGFLSVLNEQAIESYWSKDMLCILNLFFKHGNVELLLDDIVELAYFSKTLSEELNNDNVDLSDERMNYNVNMLELKCYHLQKNYGEFVDSMLGIGDIWGTYNSLIVQFSENDEKNTIYKQLDKCRQSIFIAQYLDKKEGYDDGNNTEKE